MILGINKFKVSGVIDLEKRILHITSSLRKSSGVMSVIMNYYKNIDKEKIQFDFLFFRDLEDTYQDEIEKMGGEVYLSPDPKNILKFIRFINQFFYNKSNEYIAVHLHEAYLNSLILPVAKKYDIKHRIIHNHATKYSDKKINSIRNKILCIPIKKTANHFMACSEAAGIFLFGKNEIEKNNIYILNNAIEINKFKFCKSIREKIRRELLLEDKLVVGHVGRFNEPKNHVYLIEVFSEVYKKNKNALLILIGEGPLSRKVRSLVKELNLTSKVLFLGLRTDVNELMQAMDIFVLPSLYEGLPVVAVEAQASGLPCIISNSITDEIKITDLVTFKSLNQSPSEWADDILNINNKHSRYDTSRKIIDAGYDIKSAASRLEEYYVNLE